MSQAASEMVVPWNFGNLRQVIMDCTWEDFSDQQKNRWLRELDADGNLFTRVRLLPRRHLLELYFQRRIPGQGGDSRSTTYVAGKWVKITEFKDVLDEAVKFFR